MLPCCHMVHEKCMNNFILKTKKKDFKLKCPMCKTNIDEIITENNAKFNKKYKQICIDMKSVKLNDTESDINYLYIPMSIVKFTTIVNTLLAINSTEEFNNIVNYVINACNIKINVVNNMKKNKLLNIDNTLSIESCEKNVFIANHSHYLDSIIMRHLFKCGFIASDFINQLDIGRIVANKFDLLIFKRGVDKNVVNKIKTYLDDKKKIVIYPEGAMGSNETLLKFRSGAFNVDAPVCPVVIKYNPFVWDDNFNQFVLKILTHNEIKVDVYINDLQYPPFDDKKIEKVRNIMANAANLKKSRVSNRFFKD